MYRDILIALICVAIITLVLLSLLHILQIYRPSLLDLEQFEYSRYNANFFFSVILLGLLLLSYIKRRKRIRLILSLSLGLLSYVCWSSIDADWWKEYDIKLYEQRLLAIIFLDIGFWVLVSRSVKEKRRHFSEIVRRQVIQKQNGKCAKCKKKLLSFGMDLDHRNGDRSNNKLSNCQVLCVPCHRRKHA
jgi:UDP-N-acetylmuramyl pentapeptide phosphotransferase/UDP-N-acetylglucosamine-1-phosphate transferase